MLFDPLRYFLVRVLLFASLNVMVNDAGDWVYTMGASASALGDKRVRVEVVWFVSPACIPPSRYVCLRGWRNVTWTCSCDSRRFTRGCGLVCCNVIWRIVPSLGWWSTLTCALTVNVIGLLLLWQCFLAVTSLTETSTSGTSRKLPRWKDVSQYVYWRATWRDVSSCYCDWRVQSGVWVGGDYVM